MAKALHVPLDTRIVCLPDTPHTVSYVIRKRQQIDNLSELPKEKRPPDSIIWDGTTEDLDDWLDRVFNKNEKQSVDLLITEIEE